MPDRAADVTRIVAGGRARGMSDDQIRALVARYDERTRDTAPQSVRSNREPDSALGRYVSGVWEMVNPVTIVKGLATAIANPIDTGRAIIEAQKTQLEKAREAYGEGRYSEMVGHGAAGVLPVIGPAAADIGEQIGSGDVAGGLGRATGIVAPYTVRPAVQALRRRVPSRQPTPLTRSQEAVQFAQERGIPMSAGTATGNPVVRGIEQINTRTSPSAAVITGRAHEAQAGALTREAGKLADDIAPVPVTPEQAGQGLRDAVRGAVRDAGAQADDAYGRLRALEQARAKTTQVGTATTTSPIVDASGNAITTTTPVTQTMLAVNVKSAKEALDPIYKRLKRESELVPLQGGKARALTALDRLMRGPDDAPLSVVDSALGDLKSLARADIPELRTQGQGVAAQAVTFLDRQVQAAAKHAGDDVLTALMEGRKATIAKYVAGDLLEGLRTEPVQVFRQATYAKDAGIDQLRELAKIAPKELPKIGRAFIEDLLETATAEGGFGKAGTIASKWESLGPKTKALLYRPDQIKALDNFFLFAKNAGQSVNPSGSGFTAALAASGVFKVMNPATGIPIEIGQAALAKLLESPRTVQLLTRSLRTPAKSVHGRQMAKEILERVAPTAAITGASIPATRPVATSQP